MAVTYWTDEDDRLEREARLKGQKRASIRTTERYLGMEQDLTDAPCDGLGLSLS
jgi:hypothetical protein